MQFMNEGVLKMLQVEAHWSRARTGMDRVVQMLQVRDESATPNGFEDGDEVGHCPQRDILVTLFEVLLDESAERRVQR